MSLEDCHRVGGPRDVVWLVDHGHTPTSPLVPPEILKPIRPSSVYRSVWCFNSWDFRDFVSLSSHLLTLARIVYMHDLSGPRSENCTRTVACAIGRGWRPGL